MSWFSEGLKLLNDNTGVTLILSAIGFGFNESIKTRNIKRIGNQKFKADNIDVKTREIENELYLILANFCLEDDYSEENCINAYEKVRSYIINNNLFLRDNLTEVGSKFADYIIEEVSIGSKDLQKEEDLLNKYKKLFRE